MAEETQKSQMEIAKKSLDIMLAEANFVPEEFYRYAGRLDSCDDLTDARIGACDKTIGDCTSGKAFYIRADYTAAWMPEEDKFSDALDFFRMLNHRTGIDFLVPRREELYEGQLVYCAEIPSSNDKGIPVVIILHQG